MLIKILYDFLLDLMAGAGILLTTISPLDFVTDVEKSLAGLGGLIMLYYSIRYKILLIEKEKRENQKAKEDEQNKGDSE